MANLRPAGIHWRYERLVITTVIELAQQGFYSWPEIMRSFRLRSSSPIAARLVLALCEAERRGLVNIGLDADAQLEFGPPVERSRAA